MLTLQTSTTDCGILKLNDAPGAARDWAGGRVCLISLRGTVRHSEREGLVERRRDRATDDVGSLGLDDLVLLQQAHPYVHVCMECISHIHRHRTDKYLDTLLANQPISDGEATDRCQKVAPKMKESSSSSISRSRRGPSRRCTTMSAVYSTSPEISNWTCGIVS